jgi:hypothetical protein
MAIPNQAEIIWSTERLSGTIYVSGAQYIAGGWISGTAVTQTIPTSNDAIASVYVFASGSNAPVAAKFVDNISGVTVATLTLPTANNAAVSHIGAGISGSTTANVQSFVPTPLPISSRVEVQNATQVGTAFKIVVVGR